MLAEAEFFAVLSEISARCSYTDKKENQIFLIYKEIQMLLVAKHMRKDFLMRKYLTIYEEALVIYDFATNPFWISLYVYEEIFISFLSVLYIHGTPLGTPLSNKSMHVEVGQGCLLY